MPLYEKAFRQTAVRRYKGNDAFFKRMFTDAEVMKSIISMTGPLLYQRLRGGNARKG